MFHFKFDKFALCFVCLQLKYYGMLALCGLRGCKNRPAPSPGQMSYVLKVFYVVALLGYKNSLENMLRVLEISGKI